MVDHMLKGSDYCLRFVVVVFNEVNVFNDVFNIVCNVSREVWVWFLRGVA